MKTKARPTKVKPDSNEILFIYIKDAIDFQTLFCLSASDQNFCFAFETKNKNKKTNKKETQAC